MNVLVTGANGQLGMSLRKRANACEWTFTDIVDVQGEETERLDITDLAAVRAMVTEKQITVIINCAGYTNVDAAETNSDLAELLNATAVENLAIAMKEVNGLLVHISTDYVFGGNACNVPIDEDQLPAPTSAYGRSKLHGEEAVQRVGCNHIIFRTAWLYSEYGKNFVKTMLNLTATRPQLKVVFDQVGTPTYAGDLAEAILVAIDRVTRHARPDRASLLGTYHYSNEGVCSWYDFAKMIAEYSGHTACDIQPCHSSEYPSPVKRPAYSVLDKTKVKECFGLEVPYWTDSLKHCMENL